MNTQVTEDVPERVLATACRRSGRARRANHPLQGIMARKAWIFRCCRAADCAADDEDNGNAALRAAERAHEAGQGRKTLRPLNIPGESVNQTFE